MVEKCKKIKFSWEGAIKELKRLKDLKRWMPNIRHENYYYCKACKCYHLTSQKKGRDIKKPPLK